MTLKDLKYGQVVRFYAYGTTYDAVVREVRLSDCKRSKVDRGFFALYYLTQHDGWTPGGFFERPTNIELLHENYETVKPPGGWPPNPNA